MRLSLPEKLVSLCILLSFLALAIIVWCWTQSGRDHGHAEHILDTPRTLRTILDAETSAGRIAQFESGAPVLIPTGVFIQSLVFQTSTNINLTGYVWQEYPLDFPYRPGINFPEQIASGDTVIEEQYRRQIEIDGEPRQLIGWYFDVTVRQPFDYSHYPLDFLTVWLRIWPLDFDNSDRILLVPDFDGYADHTAPVKGLDRDIVTDEWQIDETFFSYQEIPYDTLFGYPFDHPGNPAETYYDLYFNLGVQRAFVNAFVVNLVPLVVVALLLFATVMMTSRDETQSARFGFNTSGLIGTCSALFFVVMLSHIQVHQLFPGSSLVYIEYFYLVMYGMILLTALNGYLFSLISLRNLWLLHYRDNFVAKITFWPVLLCTLAVISLLTL